MNLLSTLLLLLIVSIFELRNIQSLNQQSINLFNNNILVRMSNDGQNTQFYISSPLGNGVDPNNAWIALGFNNEPQMRNANAVICRYSLSSSFIQQYYNPIYLIPQLVSSSNPTIGLTTTSVTIINGNLTCIFKRANQVQGTSNYYQLTSDSSPYLISAFGSGNINYHGANKQVSQNRLNFGLHQISTQTPDDNFQNNLFIQFIQFFSYIYNLLFKRQ